LERKDWGGGGIGRAGKRRRKAATMLKKTQLKKSN